MKILKWIVLTLAGVFVVLQFIRPERNVAPASTEGDISEVVEVPEDVAAMLDRSCFDCHSNTTRYPWYAEIQPVGWWLASHIREARKELNFSEFASYRPRRQVIKLGQIGDEVHEEKMPLPSYLIAHSEARLSPEQRARLVGWAAAAQESLKNRYPPDSLRQRQD